MRQDQGHGDEPGAVQMDAQTLREWFGERDIPSGDDLPSKSTGPIMADIAPLLSQMDREEMNAHHMQYLHICEIRALLREGGYTK